MAIFTMLGDHNQCWDCHTIDCKGSGDFGKAHGIVSNDSVSAIQCYMFEMIAGFPNFARITYVSSNAHC